MQAASDGALGDKLSKMRTLSGTAAHKGGRRVQRSDVSKLTDGKVASPHHNEIQMTPRLSNTIMTAALVNDVDFFPPFGEHLGLLFTARLLSKLAAEKCLSL